MGNTLTPTILFAKYSNKFDTITLLQSFVTKPAMTKIIIFVILSSIIFKISWPALFNAGSRKFYRFFAFEFLLILILVNSGYWFFKPFSLFQNTSLLAASLFIVMTVFIYATALTEEKENMLKFGADYAVYIKKSKIFVPFLF